MARMIDMDKVLGQTVQIKIDGETYSFNNDEIKVRESLQLMRSMMRTQVGTDPEKRPEAYEAMFADMSKVLVRANPKFTAEYLMDNLSWKKAQHLIAEMVSALYVDEDTDSTTENPSTPSLV